MQGTKLRKYRLILMRHGKSDWKTDAKSDFDRPLTARGGKDARRMGRWLKQQRLIPDRFIASPAIRALQTAYRVADELGIQAEDITQAVEIYNASLEGLLNLIASYAPGNETLMLIGHNPGLDDLLCYLTEITDQHDSRGKLMTTCAVAVLDYGSGPIHPGRNSSVLEGLLRPKE